MCFFHVVNIDCYLSLFYFDYWRKKLILSIRSWLSELFFFIKVTPAWQQSMTFSVNLSLGTENECIVTQTLIEVAVVFILIV